MNDLRNGANRRRAHPGAGRRVALPFPKGRQAEPEEIVAVQNILGDRPRTRELLIEHLHLIQDATAGFGLPADLNKNG